MRSLWCKIKQNSPWNIHQGLYHYHLEFLILEQFDQVQGLERLCNTSPHFQGRLQAFCEQERIPFINPLPRFREVSLQKQLFYPYDGHFNKEGHRLMAEHILDALTTRQIFPQN